MSKSMKRIHKVVIKRMVDESPDTSWLGEYGQRAESDYAIDRTHAIDCPQQTFNSKSADRCMTVIAYTDQLERAITYLQEQRRAVGNNSDDIRYWSLDASIDTLAEEQDEIQEEANACTCGGQHLDRNSYQYFNPNHENYTGEPESDIVKYCLQDYARMESMNRGDFCFLGIRADAEYSVPRLANDGKPSNLSYLAQEMTSGGLWGIESDSSPEYLKEIEQEQLSELKSQLKAIGFSSRAISAAFKNVETEGI